MPHTEIVPFGPRSDQSLYDTERPGFLVVGPRPDCLLWAYEGFSLGNQTDSEFGVEPLVEHDIVELAMMCVPPDLSRTGVGRALMCAAAEETRQRGYDRLRFSAHNARIIFNLTKLVDERVLSSVEYFRCPSSETVPSDWLPALGDRLSSAESRNYIDQGPEKGEDGYSPNNYIATLVQL